MLKQSRLSLYNKPEWSCALICTISVNWLFSSNSALRLDVPWLLRIHYKLHYMIMYGVSDDVMCLAALLHSDFVSGKCVL